MLFGSRDNSVGIVTGYGLDDQGAGGRVPVGQKIFTSPWGRRVRENVDLYIHSPTRLHGVVLN
jgi:hypothetical protein